MGKNILLVDDDEFLLEILASSFARAGWNVSRATDGSEALAIIKESVLDIIISDIRMPHLSGIGLLRKTRKMKNNGMQVPPLIIMTGLLDQGNEYLRKLGAVEVLLKPVKFEALLKVIEGILGDQTLPKNIF